MGSGFGSVFTVVGSILVAAATGVACLGLLGGAAGAFLDRVFAPAIPVLLVGSVFLGVGVWSAHVDDGPMAVVVKVGLTWGLVCFVVVVLQLLRHSAAFDGIEQPRRWPDDYDTVA